jgi:hypothetical protein
MNEVRHYPTQTMQAEQADKHRWESTINMDGLKVINDFHPEQPGNRRSTTL